MSEPRKWWKVGPPEDRDRIRFSIDIREDQAEALTKLRVAKRLRKSEIVELALDLLTEMPPDDIAELVKERRKGHA